VLLYVLGVVYAWGESENGVTTNPLLTFLSDYDEVIFSFGVDLIGIVLAIIPPITAPTIININTIRQKYIGSKRIKIGIK
jgi:hypothetical protein